VIDAAAYPTLKNLMTSSGSRLDNKAVGTYGRVHDWHRAPSNM
jgi:hypothetical protein